MECEKDYIKESVAAIAIDLQFPNSLVSMLVKFYHKQFYLFLSQMPPSYADLFVLIIFLWIIFSGACDTPQLR
jgi:hypothetical protein